MLRRINLIMLFLLLLPGFAQAFWQPAAKVTVKVINEKGLPIEDADVRVSFIHPKTMGWGTTDKRVQGVSGEKGEFVAKSSSTELIGITVEKQGYYHSSTGYEFEKVTLRRWQPWNPVVEVVLKKKKNPIPMYAQSTDYIKIPKEEVPVGFDLEKGDWVAPYGHGVIDDFVLNFRVSRYEGYNDYACSLEISFQNEQDGIQTYKPEKLDQSYFKWPYDAPENGYVKKIYKMRSNRPDKGYQSSLDDDAFYVFRVRTKVDKDGHITSAKYGKIKGDFRFDIVRNFKIKYWLNPSGTRNLEFDPDQNLMKWSSRRDEQKHRIREP